MSELTVFVISSGYNPNYQNCLDALSKQTIAFKLDIIKDYAPMSKAFQEMLSRCKTKYYVEVDEDMILQPNALEIMYDIIKQTNDKTSMVCFRLHDVHFDFFIYGVKIYKFDIFKKYPYDLSSMSCEVEQLERMKKEQYTYLLKEDVLGQHSPLWTEDLIYDRYFNLMEKFKEFKYVWLESVPSKLYEKFKKDPSKINLYALLGAYTSITNTNIIQKGEKDFTKTRKQQPSIMESFLEFPVTSSFYVTSKCNFKCSFCRRQHQEMETFPDFTIELAGKIITRFPTIQSVCIAGQGEPLLCDNFIQLLRFLKDQSKFVGLITNGSLLKFFLHDMLLKKPDYISVSLNAPNATIHEQINKTFTFNDVISGIEMLVDNKIPTYLSYVCTKQNLHYIPEFLRLAKSLKVQSVHLHNMLPHFKDEDDEQFWNTVITKNDEALLEEYKKDPNASIVSRFPVLINRDEIRRECRFPWKTINFDGNGYVSICPSVCEPQKQNGHIEDFIIWQNEYCNDLRNSLINEQKKYCRKCFRNWKWD